MAEFIFKKSDYTNADPEKDRRGTHKIGDIINHKPDGWAANWPNVGDYANHFVCIRCPEITLAEAQTADHRKSWKDDFDYEVISSNQGNVTLRVWNKSTSPSGANGLTREKVDGYLNRWGCTDVSFANRSVTFTFNLWNAVRSSEFWDIELIGTKVNFTLISYNSTTRIGRTQVDIIQENWSPIIRYISIIQFLGILAANGLLDYPGDNTEITIDGITYTTGADNFADVGVHGTQEEIEEKIKKMVLGAIESRGGTIISNNYPTIIFEIERNDIISRFRQEIKQKAEQVYRRHQYSISAADVAAIVAVGGVVTMTRAEFLGKLINHLGI